MNYRCILNDTDEIYTKEVSSLLLFGGQETFPRELSLVYNVDGNWSIFRNLGLEKLCVYNKYSPLARYELVTKFFVRQTPCSPYSRWQPHEWLLSVTQNLPTSEIEETLAFDVTVLFVRYGKDVQQRGRGFKRVEQAGSQPIHEANFLLLKLGKWNFPLSEMLSSTFTLDVRRMLRLNPLRCAWMHWTPSRGVDRLITHSHSTSLFQGWICGCQALPSYGKTCFERLLLHLLASHYKHFLRQLVWTCCDITENACWMLTRHVPLNSPFNSFVCGWARALFWTAVIRVVELLTTGEDLPCITADLSAMSQTEEERHGGAELHSTFWAHQYDPREEERITGGVGLAALGWSLCRQ